jgi:hypothetical protein
MKPKCPNFLLDGRLCDSEWLDQGISGQILCHDCGCTLLLVKQK